MTRAESISIFCEEIWAWYTRHKRTLPWRDLDDTDSDHKAYLVMVSEIMLQQTQVSRVIILYKKFIQTFPKLQALAKASNKDILIAWRGLGYNNRALRLRDAARALTPNPSPEGRGETSVFPRDMQSLQSLPGIGHYTAAAIRNFAFGIPTPCMDINIRRILHRFFVGIENADGTWKKDDGYLLRLAGEVLDVALASRKIPMSPTKNDIYSDSSESSASSDSSEWHAALMDFGSLVMTKNSPKWEEFTPRMKSVCRAYGKQITRTKKLNNKEPGRMMAGRFVPNRIFRGKIIEALRDARTKLTIEQLGRQAIADWHFEHHEEWMQSLLVGLKRDKMITEVRGKFVLAD